MNSVNQMAPINTKYTNVTLEDMRPTKAHMKRAFLPMWRGTIVGSLCALIPGTGLIEVWSVRKPRPTPRCRATSSRP
jgi:TctA family transporter